MLCLFFLLPASIKEAWAMHPILPLVLNILNTIFWFVGGVATAAYLNVHSCSNADYYNSNNVAGGSEKKCREAQASTAFLWLGFLPRLDRHHWPEHSWRCEHPCRRYPPWP